MKAVLSVVVPAYNEEEVLEASHKRLTAVLTGLGSPYELIFVNDGSKDKTAEILDRLAAADECVRFITFSRNFGHMAAITAGIEHASGDAVIVIDADLQDPPEIIPRMVEKWREGYDVVYGKRSKRQGESLFKKISAAVYYRILKRISNINIPVDTGEFRLIDRKVCDVMTGIKEHNRYMRGLVSWVGFRQCAVEFVREERFAGKAKYSLGKMVELSINGLTAFSIKPLRLASLAGAFLSAGGFIWLLIQIIGMITGQGRQDWAVITAVLLLTQGFILLAIGILGEYVGRIFDETKARPAYIIQETKGFRNEGE
ncbi:MAG: glycosyltransferase family 2 protein [Clostridiales bacterium]|jgi:dolichol-phosphate mannosyltransferase|nr:glycosyltransferase family 2 protein [Clostridiales bacterium]